MCDPGTRSVAIPGSQTYQKNDIYNQKEISGRLQKNRMSEKRGRIPGSKDDNGNQDDENPKKIV